MSNHRDHVTGLIDDLLAEVRRLDGEATEGPWEAETWEVRPSPLARARSASIGGTSPSPSYDGTVDVIDCDGVYGVTSGYDAKFIALARTALPALAAAVEAVMEVHRPISVYAHEDECENPDEEHRENRHHEYADDAGEFYCEDLFQYTVCVGCKDSPYVDWFDDWPQYPCPTIRALNEAMKGSDNE